MSFDFNDHLSKLGLLEEFHKLKKRIGESIFDETVVLDHEECHLLNLCFAHHRGIEKAMDRLIKNDARNTGKQTDKFLKS